MNLTERLQEAFDKRVCGTAMLPASDLLSAMSAIEQLEKTITINFEEMQKDAASSDEPRLVSYGLEMETCTLNFNGGEYYFDLRDSTASAKQENQ